MQKKKTNQEALEGLQINTAGDVISKLKKKNKTKTWM